MPVDLLNQIHELAALTIDDRGVEIPHALIITRKGELITLMVEPQQAYTGFLTALMRYDGVEAIMGLDRFTKPGQQGTKYAFAGQYYKRGDDVGKSIFDASYFTPFIIEYQIEPRIVDPINWDNEFWNHALTDELGRMLDQMFDQMQVYTSQ